MNITCHVLPGYNRGIKKETFHFNSETAIWTRKQDLPIASYNVIAVVIPGTENRYILAGGGPNAKDNMFK